MVIYHLGIEIVMITKSTKRLDCGYDQSGIGRGLQVVATDQLGSGRGPGDDYMVRSSMTSEDPINAKWSYWREDALLHSFHSHFHEIYRTNMNTSGYGHRTNELFFYMHQQFMRRYAMRIKH